MNGARDRDALVALVVTCLASRLLVMRSNRMEPPLPTPPAYTPPPSGTAPAEDTPDQRAAMAAIKSKNEEQIDTRSQGTQFRSGASL